ncbi:probable carboxylesterase 9 [Solanum lycopersicum]|uniref:Alpha/beta hydrolase fold-3 domain-containing protein n=1 Tax=Solanum lycopersicum TaxID=4081 RepID=A0A3Q7EL81_SOLLC|nr:probable carboxylesterase 9 [Solanum lycopersicum]
MSKFDPYEHLNVVLNQDGSITRLLDFPTTQATGDQHHLPGQAVVSKDITLNEEKKTWMRLYRPSKLPSNDKSVAKLPIIVYLHTGGWIHFSVASTLIHESCNQLCSEVPSIVVALDYGLAPENKLPSQYHDTVEAVVWIKNQALDRVNGEKWLREYGDFSRCYLYGVSCGGNIAFNSALKLLDNKLEPLRINGVILNQPLFGGKMRTKSEMRLATDPYFPLPVIDALWDFALPKGTDRDHRFCNPMMNEPCKDKIKRLGRCLVIGFGGDPLVDRQQEFVQMLVKQGVMVEARFDDVGFHGIEVVDSRRAAAIINFVKEFV